MRNLDLTPKIFSGFPEIKTIFAVGKFKFGLSPRDEVLEERAELLKILGLKKDQVISLNQTQSDKAFYVTPESQIGFLAEPNLSGDGLYTDHARVFLSVVSADCLPILFYNEKVRLVGIYHGGWQGTAKKAFAKVISEISEKFNLDIPGFRFYFGPAAQVCCYEVTAWPERAEIFRKVFGKQTVRKEDGGIFLDFVKANLMQVAELGAGDNQIENSGICTIHNQEYPSHRREGVARKETVLSIIGLEK